MKRVKLYIVNILLTIAGFLMQERGKRILLIASLHTVLFEEGILKNLTLDKLNNELELVKYEDALLLPQHNAALIWNSDRLRGCVIGSCESELDVTKVANNILEIVPSWLKYNLTKMESDIIDIFITDVSMYKAR